MRLWRSRRETDQRTVVKQPERHLHARVDDAGLLLLARDLEIALCEQAVDLPRVLLVVTREVAVRRRKGRGVGRVEEREVAVERQVRRLVVRFVGVGDGERLPTVEGWVSEASRLRRAREAGLTIRAAPMPSAASRSSCPPACSLTRS